LSVGVDMEDEEVGKKVDVGLPQGKTVDVLFINAGYFTTETFEELNFKVNFMALDRPI